MRSLRQPTRQPSNSTTSHAVELSNLKVLGRDQRNNKLMYIETIYEFERILEFILSLNIKPLENEQSLEEALLDL
jgi:hypothetical protein